MRDITRIIRIATKLAHLWNKYPDWRLGQLISNLKGPGVQDVFFWEDDKWEEAIDNPPWEQKQ